jgi:hypothetical protein
VTKGLLSRLPTPDQAPCCFVCKGPVDLGHAVVQTFNDESALVATHHACSDVIATLGDTEPPGAEPEQKGEFSRVIVESPYAGDVEQNERYARAALADCLRRGEAPFASHLLYTQPGVLDDGNAEERHKGIVAGFAWREAAALTVFYIDLGFSSGMEMALVRVLASGAEFEYRTLAGWSRT